MGEIKRTLSSATIGLVAWIVGSGLMFLASMSNLADDLEIEFGSVISDPDHFGLLSSSSTRLFWFFTIFAILLGMAAGVVTTWLMHKHLGEVADDGELPADEVEPVAPGRAAQLESPGGYGSGVRQDIQWGGPISAPFVSGPETANAGGGAARAVSPQRPMHAPRSPRWADKDSPAQPPPSARPRWYWEPEEVPPPRRQSVPVSSPTPRASVGPDYRWSTQEAGTLAPGSEPASRTAPKARVRPNHRWGTQEAGTLPPKSTKLKRTRSPWGE